MDQNIDQNLSKNSTNSRFVSAQRRYDNIRVRDSEITKRLCYDCGEIICGEEREYQEHVLVHEAVYLAYQLYHFENNQPQYDQFFETNSNQKTPLLEMEENLLKVEGDTNSTATSLLNETIQNDITKIDFPKDNILSNNQEIKSETENFENTTDNCEQDAIKYLY